VIKRLNESDLEVIGVIGRADGLQGGYVCQAS